MQLISRLPPYPLQAREEELCPPTITVLDENDNGLSISATQKLVNTIYSTLETDQAM